MNNDTIRKVFLGIDVHKKTYSITAISNNLIIKKASMPADPQVLLAFIQRFFPTDIIHSAYEAGFSGFSLHRFLIDNGINNIVIHPASIEVEAKNKCKNDKRDSAKIAKHLSYSNLRCINIPTPQRECWRAVSRLRSQFVQEKSRYSCRIKSFLFYHGLLPHTHKGKCNRKWIKNLLTIKGVYDDIFYCIKFDCQMWLYLDDQIKKIKERFKEQAKKDKAVGEIYQRSHGIGLISSRILANELGDLSQFHSEKALFSYTGLTPTEHSSGEKRRLGNISRQGNTAVRGILTEAAWKAIKKDSDLKAIFDRLVQNTSSRKKAILGIARRMIGRTRAEFKKDRNFKESLKEGIYVLDKSYQ